MYLPKHHEETRIDVIDRLIRSHPLASLVTTGTSGLFATHLPMVLHRSSGERAVLHGHLSRANKQWKEFSPEIQALAIFSGPEHYITPNWYPEKQISGKVVPTWNYAVVHAHGPLRVIQDSEWLLAHLHSLTDANEASQTMPWSVNDAPKDFIASLMNGIVGIELAIERLEGEVEGQPKPNRPDSFLRGAGTGWAWIPRRALRCVIWSKGASLDAVCAAYSMPVRQLAKHCPRRVASQLKRPACKAGARSTLVEPTFIEQGPGSYIWFGVQSPPVRNA